MADDGAGGAHTRAHPDYVVADGLDTLLTVRVIPRASRTCLAGERAGALLVRLSAPPVDNAANDALLRFIAEVLGVPRSNLSVAQGERTRTKRVRVRQITAQAAAARLAASQGITFV
jgi:hypothetical protein